MFGILAAGYGCGADNIEALEASEGEFALSRGDTEIDYKEAPEEVVHRGQRYVRADLYVEPAEELALKDAPAEGPSARGKLARQLRAHMLKGGVHYVQAELDYALVDRIASGETPPDTEGSRPLEGRHIYGTDDRFQTSALWFLANSFAFSEIGVTASLIGETTALTCGHCMYETYEATNGWLCRDNSVSSNCSGIGYPQWKIGELSGTDGDWLAYSCIVGFVPQQFIDLTVASANSVRARWDFGVLDINCPEYADTDTFFPTSIYTDTQLLNTSARLTGYPTRVPCPNGSTGSSSNCPSGAFQPLGSPPPYTGATLWTSPDVSDTEALNAYIMKNTLDTTGGNSGSPILVHTGFGYHTIIGVQALSTPSYNIHRRWTSDLYNWVAARSDFPN